MFNIVIYTHLLDDSFNMGIKINNNFAELSMIRMKELKP